MPILISQTLLQKTRQKKVYLFISLGCDFEEFAAMKITTENHDA
jgi:hypothetical protein